MQAPTQWNARKTASSRMQRGYLRLTLFHWQAQSRLGPVVRICSPRIGCSGEGRLCHVGPLPPPPPPSSFSVSTEVAILLLPRAGVGGLSLLQVRPPAVPPLHGHRPLRTVSPPPSSSDTRQPLGLPLPPWRAKWGRRRLAWPVGYRRRSWGSAPEGRSPAPPPSVGACGPTQLPPRSSPRRRVIPRPCPVTFRYSQQCCEL